VSAIGKVFLLTIQNEIRALVKRESDKMAAEVPIYSKGRSDGAFLARSGALSGYNPDNGS
jgi:hypothetical protein